MSDLKYVHERLDSLHEVDTKLVSSLDNLSSILTTLQKGKLHSDDSLQIEFTEKIKSFYSNLSDASIGLRKEMKCLDDKIANDNNNDSINILPININKKLVWTGDDKLNKQIELLDELLKN